MLILEAGYRQVWPGFALDLVQELRFCQESRYQLHGSNGSGKSSFLQKLLLPALQDNKAGYIVYLQQQIYLQLFALKAHTAFNLPGYRISDAQDAARYLLRDLRIAYNQKAQDIYLIADESPALDILMELELPHCLILIDHHRRIPEAGLISFSSPNPKLSRVRADA
ncbi:MAG: hypothetical protein PHU99_01780 [Candidatus Cloacimonetes bacterium]|nr:hypothetical protein [Candidatus Cloacimonadota bacterium]